MAEIQLQPEHGGDPIDVPSDKITIGRGAFMKVTDKRVSRNHATLEINSNRELIITPIHTNPCFMKVKSTGEKLTLPKDKPQLLRNGDLLGLLPESLYFKVVYKEQDNGEIETSDTETESCMQSEERNSERVDIKDAHPLLTNNTDKEVKHATDGHAKAVTSSEHEVGSPEKRTRILPNWMRGAAKRISINSQTLATKCQTVAGKAWTQKNNQIADEERVSYRAAPNRRGRGAPRKRAVQESEEEDWDDEQPQRSRRTKRHRKTEDESDGSFKRSRRRTSRYFSDSEESESEEPQIKKREPRMSAQKLLTYKDEFDLGEVGLSSSESEVGGQFGSWKKDDDSDFVIDELESGSDWEISHSQSSRRGKRKGRTRSVTQTRGRRKSTRKGKRQNYNDSDLDFDDDDDDVYVPRPSKRRASNARKKRKIEEEEEEEEEEDENNEAKMTQLQRGRRKVNNEDGIDQQSKKNEVDDEDSMDISDDEEENANTADKPSATNDKTSKASNIEEDDSEEEDVENTRKSRRPCMYGKKCYRKNPLHFKEFCHPGDSSYDEAAPDETKKKDKPKRERNKAGGSADDEPNTYDYEDRFLPRDHSDVESSSSSDNPTDEDSDWSPEEENVRSLIKEAKGFIRNRKMQRPAWNK